MAKRNAARTVWRIGTRGSPLALAQARETKARLISAHGLSGDAVEIVTLSTAGDRIQDRPLSEVGGKGLFTKEIDRALLAGEVDFGVHSMKDVATRPPEGIVFPAILPREDPRDAFFARDAASLDALPAGATVGTASLRRQAQVLWRRPELRTTLLRGNVQTRMKRLEEGAIAATYLAMAGLKRLGLVDKATGVTEVDVMLPAAAQGAVGVAARADDAEAAALLEPLDDAPSAVRIGAERAFLERLDGSCRTPIAALAELADGALRFRGEVLLPDGSERHAVAAETAFAPDEGGRMRAAEMGREAAGRALEKAGPDFWAAVRAAGL